MHLFEVFVQTNEINRWKVSLVRLDVRPSLCFLAEGDVTITGEEAGLIKGLTGATAMTDVVPPTSPSTAATTSEPAPLMIDSTKPIYPRLG